MQEIYHQASSKLKNKIFRRNFIIIAIVFVIIMLMENLSSHNNLSLNDNTESSGTMDSIGTSQSLNNSSNNLKNYAVQNKPKFITYTVLKDKAYFYNSASDSAKRNAFLVKHELIQACCEQNGFVWTVFVNSEGKESKGWIKVPDLSLGYTKVTSNYHEENENLENDSITSSENIGNNLDIKTNETNNDSPLSISRNKEGTDDNVAKKSGGGFDNKNNEKRKAPMDYKKFNLLYGYPLHQPHQC